MRRQILRGALLGLAAVIAGCAYGVMPDPDEDEDEYGSGSPHNPAGQPGDPSLQPSGGSCYLGRGECNPLSNSCILEEACDLGEDYAFHCFPPPNDAEPGQSCNSSSGPYCEHGSLCVEGVCRPYCCNDADCPSGPCAVSGSIGGLTLRVCGS